MENKSDQRGQILIEVVFLVVFFLSLASFVYKMNQRTLSSQKNSQFLHQKMELVRPGGLR